jgi:hypothetical protein
MSFHEIRYECTGTVAVYANVILNVFGLLYVACKCIDIKLIYMKLTYKFSVEEWTRRSICRKQAVYLWNLQL